SLEALDLWEAVEEDLISDQKSQRKKKNKIKAKTCLFAGASQTIFTRIMTLKSTKAIWDYLREEYTRDERIQSIQVLNLMRPFELQRMKKFEIIKEYSDRLLDIANKMRLLGSDLADSRIVEKIFSYMPQAQEQPRLMREDHVVESSLLAKHHNVETNKKKHFKKN
ncbi:hypothetical protein CR513_06677, partial [Mucuna pruriens]